MGGGGADVVAELPGWAAWVGGGVDVGAGAAEPGPGAAGACTPGEGGGAAAAGGGGASELPGETGDSGAAGAGGGGAGGGAGTAPAAAVIGLAAALTGGNAELGAPPTAAADDTTPDTGVTPAAGGPAADGEGVPPAGACPEDAATGADSGAVDCPGPEALEEVGELDVDVGVGDAPDSLGEPLLAAEPVPPAPPLAAPEDDGGDPDEGAETLPLEVAALEAPLPPVDVPADAGEVTPPLLMPGVVAPAGVAPPLAAWPGSDTPPFPAVVLATGWAAGWPGSDTPLLPEPLARPEAGG